MALTKIQAAGLTADLIDETKLADNSIDSEHYNDGSIDNAHLADDAVGVDELSATGTASSSTFLRGDNSWATPTDTNTQLSTEQVQDIVGAMFTGNTETNITATYEDSDGTIDLVVGAAGAALTGSTNNTITTVTGANAIQGEANLTFDGSNLGVGETSPDKLIHLSGNNTSVSANAFTSATNTIRLTDTDTSVTSNQPGGTIEWETLDSSAAGVNAYIATKNSSTGYGSMHFGTGNASTLAERMSIHTDGNVTIADGDLVIGTAGHGIDFSMTSDATGATSELFDDYEEGVWTPTVLYGGVTSYTAQNGTYTKIGRVVIAHFRVNANGGDTTTNNVIAIGGLPFTNSSDLWGGLTITRSDNFHNGRFQGLVPTSGTECTLYQDDGTPFTWSEAGNPNNDLRGIITYHI